MSKDWADGIKVGCYKNPGSMKRKKRGKPPPKPRGIRQGIRKTRMEKRRG